MFRDIIGVFVNKEIRSNSDVRWIESIRYATLRNIPKQDPFRRLEIVSHLKVCKVYSLRKWY